MSSHAPIVEYVMVWEVYVLNCLHRFAFCKAGGSERICPPGMNINDPCPESATDCYHCPSHRDCYVPCTESEWGSWIYSHGSSYHDMAFCERFPRLPANVLHRENGQSWVYLAQTGKSEVSRHNFDNIFSSFVTIFQILTGVCQIS
jgi:hypothetical protein